MTPPIFSICAASNDVTDLLGTNPVRFYPFGQAPQGVTLPYAVWRWVFGEPENYLGGTPDIDALGTQVDVYAATGPEARAVAIALRDAIEPHAHITSWGGERIEPETQHANISFDADFWVSR